MNRHEIFRYFAWCVVTAASSAVISAQTMPRTEGAILGMLRSSSISDRHLAVTGALQLNQTNRTDKLQKAFVAELKRTQQQLKSETYTESPEDIGDYYGDLIELVASFDDEEALSPLISALDTGGMASNAVARFGDDAVNGLLEVIDSPSSSGVQVAGALSTLGTMSRQGPRNVKKPLTATSRGRITSTVKRILRTTENIYVLEEAAILAYAVEDQAAVSVVEDMASRPDTWKGRRFQQKDGQRRAAALLVDVVRNRGKSGR